MSDHALANPVRARATRTRSIVSHVLLVVVAVLFLTPLIYTVVTSLKPANEVFSTPPSLVGSQIRWQNYADAWNFLPLGRFILNGFFVALAGTLVVLVSSSFSGYAFARLRWRGREGMFLLFLATLMIPQEVLVVPMFILMQWLGWVDSYQALIFPWAFTAFGTFLLRQFFLTIPPELEDAARIDGAGVVRRFVQIVLPLARPALSVLAVFTFINYQNSYLWPLIITSTVEKRGTVPLGLSLFFGQQGNQWNLVMAATVITIVPTVALVLAMQKHLVSGIATTGLAGR
jgi:multiple sugar transport system permease protein